MFKYYTVTVLFILAILIPSISASAISVNTIRGVPDTEAVISDIISYRDGAEVIFYKGSTEYIRVVAVAAPSILIGSSPIRPTSSEFRFIIPRLPPDVYSIRLGHPDIGLSDPASFSIVPLVTSIAQSNNSIRIEGSGFGYLGQRNIARLFPLTDILKLETVQPQIIVSFSLDLTPWITYSYSPPVNDTGILVNSVVVISGSGVPSARGSAYLDINGNRTLDSWEPSKNVDVSTAGEFSASLYIPADILVNNVMYLTLDPKTPTGSYKLEIFTIAGDNVFEAVYRTNRDVTIGDR